MRLELERKHVKIGLMFLNELLRICQRNIEKKRIGAVTMELKLAKDIFGVLLNDIKSQELRTEIARRINELDEELQRLRLEIFGKKENKG